MFEQTQESTILCNSGIYFDIAHPHPNDVRIHDIVTALSRICRFGGHCDKFYSVAQHSLLVSHIVPPHLALEGLLHDAAEAYIGDITAPLKQFLPDYKTIELKIEACISVKYGLSLLMSDAAIIKRADLIMLLTEKRDLFVNEKTPWHTRNPALVGLEPLKEHINPVNSGRAMELFMLRFNQLMKERYANA